MLMRVKSVEQFLLFLDLSADDSQVKYLNEMGYIHPCVLHDMTVLLIGINGRGVVVFGLHDYVLEGHKEALRFAEHFIRNHLFGEVRFLCASNSVLQRMQSC